MMELLGGLELAGYLQSEDVNLPSANWPLLPSWSILTDPSSKSEPGQASSQL